MIQRVGSAESDESDDEEGILMTLRNGKIKKNRKHRPKRRQFIPIPGHIRHDMIHEDVNQTQLEKAIWRALTKKKLIEIMKRESKNGRRINSKNRKLVLIRQWLEFGNWKGNGRGQSMYHGQYAAYLRIPGNIDRDQIRFVRYVQSRR